MERQSDSTPGKNGRTGTRITSFKLTDKIKSLVRAYIIQSDEFPSNSRWVDGLFQFLRKYDARIEEQDVKRWINTHVWIVQEAYHQSQKVTNTNTGHSDGSGVPARQSQALSYQMDQGSSGVQIGATSSTSTSTSAPATSDSQKRLKKFQKAIEVVLELKLLMEDDDLQECCRAHIGLLKPLAKSLTQGQKSILSPISRAELYQRSLLTREDDANEAAHSSGDPTSRKRSKNVIKIELPDPHPEAIANHPDDEEGLEGIDTLMYPGLITL